MKGRRVTYFRYLAKADLGPPDRIGRQEDCVDVFRRVVVLTPEGNEKAQEFARLVEHGDPEAVVEAIPESFVKGPEKGSQTPRPSAEEGARG